MEFAKLVANSDLVPKDYKGKPGNVLIAVQMGAELGLSPMQAVQNIAVINGRPSLWGDALLAVVQSHPECQDVIETSTATEASCRILRRGHEPTVRKFSIDDAKLAGLWGKQGPWTNYPKRMLQMRARAFACRDAFADALRGMQSAEEVGDYGARVPMGVLEVVTPAGEASTIEMTEQKEARMRQSLGGWLLEMSGGDREAAAAHLEVLSAFTASDGSTEVAGVTTLKGLTGKRLAVTYGQAKRAHETWMAALKATETMQGEEAEADAAQKD